MDTTIIGQQEQVQVDEVQVDRVTKEDIEQIEAEIERERIEEEERNRPKVRTEHEIRQIIESTEYNDRFDRILSGSFPPHLTVDRFGQVQHLTFRSASFSVLIKLANERYTVLDIYVRPDSTTILWTNKFGCASVWSIDRLDHFD